MLPLPEPPPELPPDEPPLDPPEPPPLELVPLLELVLLVDELSAGGT